MVQQKLQKKFEAKVGELIGQLKAKGKSGQAFQMLQRLGEALESAESPEDLIGIVQQIGGLMKNSQALGDVLSKALGLGAMLQQLQTVARTLPGKGRGR